MPFRLASNFFIMHLNPANTILNVVNELSTTIDLESTLVRAEALFRRFQRTVEAIDKKSNFPKPKLRQRPVSTSSNASLGGAQSLRPSSPNAVASTSGVDSVSAGNTNSNSSPQGAISNSDERTKDKGKAIPKANAEELVDQRPKVVSDELRELLSRKVEVLPRKVVRREGEGLGSLGKKKG